jgi:hypothetical protein
MPTNKRRKSKPEIITQRDLHFLRQMESVLAAFRRNIENKLARGAKIERGRFKAIPGPPRPADLARWNFERKATR